MALKQQYALLCTVQYICCIRSANAEIKINMRDAVGSTAAGFCIRAIIKKVCSLTKWETGFNIKEDNSEKDDKIAIDFKIKKVYAIVFFSWDCTFKEGRNPVFLCNVF